MPFFQENNSLDKNNIPASSSRQKLTTTRHETTRALLEDLTNVFITLSAPTGAARAASKTRQTFQMRFTKATLLITSLLLLSISLYWTAKSWLNHPPSYTARSCTILSKRITKSGSFYRTDFLVSLHLNSTDPPPESPVVAYRYASTVHNQTLPHAREFLSRFMVGNNYTCFIDTPKRGVKSWRYSVSMTAPSPDSQVWIATLFTVVAVLSLFLQLAFVRAPVAVVSPVDVVTPPPRVGLSTERVQEVCEECSVEECAICLEEGRAKGAKLPCGHAFHKLCLERWLVKGSLCPLCNCDLMVVVKEERREGDVGEGDVGRRKPGQRDSVELD